MKAVKEIKTSCAFCSNKVIRRESFAFRMGTKIKKLKVIGGYLLTTSYSSQLPICSDCWQKAQRILDTHPSKKKWGIL